LTYFFLGKLKVFFLIAKRLASLDVTKIVQGILRAHPFLGFAVENPGFLRGRVEEAHALQLFPILIGFSGINPEADDFNFAIEVDNFFENVSKNITF
jgi:hypothetical protein